MSHTSTSNKKYEMAVRANGREVLSFFCLSGEGQAATKSKAAASKRQADQRMSASAHWQMHEFN